MSNYDFYPDEAYRRLLKDLKDMHQNKLYEAPTNGDAPVWASVTISILLIALVAYFVGGGQAKPRSASQEEIRQRRANVLLQEVGSTSVGSHHNDKKPQLVNGSSSCESSMCSDLSQESKSRRKDSCRDWTEKETETTKARWKREQATTRFGKPAQATKGDSGVPESIQVRDKSFLSAGNPSDGKPGQPKRKKRIKLPEPKRFIPKVVVPDPAPLEPTLTCQPVTDNAASQATPGAGINNTQPSQAVQEALLKVLASGGGTKKEATKEEEEATVLRDGMTRFLHVPYLPNADHTSFLLKRLAREFLPIMRRRGYNVLMISEMCCCTDGFRSARGEERNANRIKVQTSSGSEDMCGGYNRTIPLGKRSVHQIFIRLRDRVNHYKFRSYKEIAKTMAHELAHCVHQGHGPGFQQLMKEVQAEHDELVLSGSVGQCDDAVEQFGFDIYGSATSRTRF